MEEPELKDHKRWQFHVAVTTPLVVGQFSRQPLALIG